MAAMLSAENMRRPSHCQCSSGSSCTAPSRRAIASSLAKMPTSRVRRLMVRFAERGEKQKLDDDDSTSRQAHGKGPRPTRGPAPRDLDARGPMDRKIRSMAGQAVYPLRKTIVEPVFGQINGTRGLSWGVVRLLELALDPGKRTWPTAVPARCQRQRGLLTWDGPPNLPANDSTRPRQQPRAAAEVDAEEKQRKPPLAEQMQQRTDAAMDPAIVKAEAFGLSEPDQGPPMGPWTRQPLGFRRFLLRGLGKANGPWGLC